MPLELMAVSSVADPAIQQEMDDIVKIFKSLKKSGLLVKGVGETIKREKKKQKIAVFDIFLGH